MEAKDEKPKKKKRFELSLEKVKGYAEALKILGEAFQALMGRKPIGQKVAILANPDNPKSMSILSRGQARFVSIAYYLASHEEWGGLFDCLKVRADEMMATSPSVNGMGRQQVIEFVGALGGQDILKKMAIFKETKEGEST